MYLYLIYCSRLLCHVLLLTSLCLACQPTPRSTKTTINNSKTNTLEGDSNSTLVSAKTPPADLPVQDRIKSRPSFAKLLKNCRVLGKGSYRLDSASIKAIQAKMGQNDLNSKAVKQLSSPLSDAVFNRSILYHLNDFYQIDSIKSMGNYATYRNSLDIGMTAQSQVQLVGKVALEENFEAFIWALDYHTFEACPYSYGTYVLATLVRKGAFVSCSLIGELSGGGDPPVFGTELTTARLRKKGVELQNRSVYGEEGDNGKTTLEIDSSSQFRKIKNYEFQE